MHDILQMWLNIQKTQSLVASIGREDEKPIIFWIQGITGFINEGGTRRGKGQGRGGGGGCTWYTASWTGFYRLLGGPAFSI